MENRTKRLHEGTVPAGRKYAASGCSSQPAEPLQTECAEVTDWFTRKSTTASGPTRQSTPRVPLHDRKSRWFTCVLPNSLLEGESLYRPNSVMRRVSA